MSVDRSLKIKNALVRHRNVLSRAERIEVLKDEERWNEGDSVLGLPKVAHRKTVAGKKSKDEEEKASAGGASAADQKSPAAKGAK